MIGVIGVREVITVQWLHILDKEAPGWQGVKEAVKARDMELANKRLRAIVVDAKTGGEMAGRWRCRRCPLMERAGAQQPAWFDQECQPSKQGFR